ncbi:NAD(P)/FAD-dependent oxidoreductase [candidate division WS5 bacterium]|uniref:NAD(P)/FAD-dependent oxidoreductase n=1 Tax=candidate division WS5 bacterium TaxID=2093353 RepID=A0A419DAI2_9BACT|nr:MAG: NAD(P)/FAD-dependent oxidoreductase [candidate division WS5 bacterium]
MPTRQKTAVIIGAGPAGLTAAFELLNRSDIKPIIFEMDDCVGGISRTIKYKGNRIDIGPHRFFSKSDRVMDFWLNILPLQRAPAKDDKLLDCTIPLWTAPDASGPEKEDRVFLYKNRITRIFFLKKFFDYPVTLNAGTLKNLGLLRILKIGITYIFIKLWPRKVEKSLEDFFINRFGKELYETFFRDYTEKVWGVSCDQIPADWGTQRVKGLSITSVIIHALKMVLPKKKLISQKKTETSLIERFLFPKFGAGQMYEEIAKKVIEKGGVIHLNSRVAGIQTNGKKIIGVQIINDRTKNTEIVQGDYFFSTMPIKELIKVFDKGVPEEVKSVADGLIYRDYILVGLLLKNMKLKNKTKIKTLNDIIPDNWIYVQEPEVKMGRLDFINNFSPYMLQDQHLIWLGAEYFCNEGDLLWVKSDKEMADFAIDELISMDMINGSEVVDYTVVRMQKTYPAYFGTYDRFDVLKTFVDEYENLFLIGRNGMHKYNNMDHSILTAMTAVDNIISGIKDKNNLWDINTEKEYHEESK